MRFFVIVGLLLFLGGCGFTVYGDATRDLVKTKGAQAYDEGLVNAEWFICSVASIGSIKRRYGISQDRLDAYNNFCPIQMLKVVPETGS